MRRGRASVPRVCFRPGRGRSAGLRATGRAVEISAAGPAFGDVAQSRLLGGPGAIERGASRAPASSRRRRTTSARDLEWRVSLGSARASGSSGVQHLAQVGERHEQLGGDGVAPYFLAAIARGGPALASDTADSPSQRWASSWASVNICADFESAPLMKTSGARSSASAKPRNSRGSSTRCVLDRTMPLTMTSTPAASACPMKSRSASAHVGQAARAARSKPSVSAIGAPPPRAPRRGARCRHSRAPAAA